MKNSKLLRVVALCLGLMLVLTGCSLRESLRNGKHLPWDESVYRYAEWSSRPYDGDDYSMQDRRTIPYEEMEYTRPDVEGMQKRITEIVELAGQAGSVEELFELEYELGGLVEEFSTMSSLAMLRSYQDTTDTYYEEEYRFCTEAGAPLTNLLNDYYRVVTEGPYAEEYCELVGEAYYQSLLDSQRLSSKETESLRQQRDQISMDYMVRIAEVDYADFEANADEFAQMYKQLIDLDKEIATMLGFESPAEMHYLSKGRDFSPEEAKQYFAYTKELFVPLYEEALSIGTYNQPVEYTVAMEKMPIAISGISEELQVAWEQMIEYGLYDFENTPNKNTSMQFTTYLYMYDAPFIFTSWTDDFSSVSTLMHEFGHYYDQWLRFDQATSNSLDVAEVYSQGLELLLQPTFDMFVDDAELAVQGQMLGLLQNTLLYLAMLAEFEMSAYEMEDVNADTLAALYTKLLVEYGFLPQSYVNDGYVDHSWFGVPHLFVDPFYVISYWVSVIVPLQMWAVAQEDWDAGVELYLEMIHADQSQPFSQLVQSVGLALPGDRVTLESIAAHLAQALGLRQARNAA